MDKEDLEYWKARAIEAEKQLQEYKKYGFVRESKSDEIDICICEFCGGPLELDDGDICKACLYWNELD